MPKLKTVIAALAVAAGTAAPAIIMRHDVDEAHYRNLGERYRPYLVQLAVTTSDGTPVLYNGMGTLIAPTWVLTAAHAAQYIPGAPEGPRPPAPHYVFIQGRGYLVKRVVYPDAEIGNEGRKYTQNDIALIELMQPVRDPAVACLYRDRDEAGRIVTFAGMGRRGDGLNGVGAGDGVLRGAMNRLDGVGEGDDPNVIWFDFHGPQDSAALDLEGISGPGDSGGPAFVEQDGRQCVVGVSSGQDTKGGPGGLYGVREYYTRVSSFRPWIESVIGVPPHVRSQSG